MYRSPALTHMSTSAVDLCKPETDKAYWMGLEQAHDPYGKNREMSDVSLWLRREHDWGQPPAFTGRAVIRHEVQATGD
jgi:hypothetical protein